MAMGAFQSRLRVFEIGALAIFAVVACLVGVRADEISLNAGTTVNGQITGVSDGQVSVTEGTVRTAIYLSDIKAVSMAPPAALDQTKNAAPAAVIATLAPLVQQYAGLPVDWVLDAMATLADAYDSQNQSAKAAALYAQIDQLYHNSPYRKVATVGLARIDLRAGKVDAALAAVKPLVAQADADVAPSPADGRIFAGAFLVYGRALEAQNQFSQALESYLTVKTMFYQNPALVAEAEADAKNLLAKHPAVGVD